MGQDAKIETEEEEPSMQEFQVVAQANEAHVHADERARRSGARGGARRRRAVTRTAWSAAIVAGALLIALNGSESRPMWSFPAMWIVMGTAAALLALWIVVGLRIARGSLGKQPTESEGG